MFALSGKRPHICLAVLLVFAAASASAQDVEKTPAMKIREVLDQPITLNLAGKDLADIAKKLSDKTGVKFNVTPGWYYDAAAVVELKAERAKLGGVLRRFLARAKLTYVVMEDSVVFVSPALAVGLQLGQIVSVHFDEVPLDDALKEVQRNTPFNLVTFTTAMKAPVSLDLENATLEAAVGIIAEKAGLKAVCVDNAICITSAEHAQKLLAEQKAAIGRNSSAGGMSYPGLPPMPYPPPYGYGHVPDVLVPTPPGLTPAPPASPPPPGGPTAIPPPGPDPAEPEATPPPETPQTPERGQPAPRDSVKTAPPAPGFSCKFSAGSNISCKDGNWTFGVGADFNWNCGTSAASPSPSPTASAQPASLQKSAAK